MIQFAEGVISLTYRYEDGGWFLRLLKSSCEILWKELRQRRPGYEGNMFLWARGWSRVCFWKDIRCDDIPLCVSFPTRFAMANSKKAKVANLWEASRPRRGWNFILKRSFNAQEWEKVQMFIYMISSRIIYPKSNDRIY